MTMQKLTIRPVNRKTGYLPKTTKGRTVILFRVSNGSVISQIYTNHETITFDVSVRPFTHYALAPTHLQP